MPLLVEMKKELGLRSSPLWWTDYSATAGNTWGRSKMTFMKDRKMGRPINGQVTETDRHRQTDRQTDRQRHIPSKEVREDLQKEVADQTVLGVVHATGNHVHHSIILRHQLLTGNERENKNLNTPTDYPLPNFIPYISSSL